jgi:hypothetical protein
MPLWRLPFAAEPNLGCLQFSCSIDPAQTPVGLGGAERIECGVPLVLAGFSISNGGCMRSALAEAVGEAREAVGVLSFFAELVACEVPVGAVAGAGGLYVG